MKISFVRVVGLSVNKILLSTLICFFLFFDINFFKQLIKKKIRRGCRLGEYYQFTVRIRGSMSVMMERLYTKFLVGVFIANCNASNHVNETTKAICNSTVCVPQLESFEC